MPPVEPWSRDPQPWSRWGNAGLMLIAWLAGVLLALVASGVLLEELPDPPTPAQDLAFGLTLALDFVLGTVVVTLLPVLRNRLPGWATLTAVAACAVSSIAVPTALLVVVWVAARRSPRRLAVTCAVLVAAGIASDVGSSRVLGLPPTPWWQAAILTVGVALVPALVGLVRGRREAAADSLEREAAALGRERDALLRQRAAEEQATQARLAEARQAERTRIARDMHDSLAHHLSLIAMHAGALEYRTDLGADATRTAAETVGRAAREANAELRQVLGVLGAGQEGADPPPDLGRVRELLGPDSRLELGGGVAGTGLDPVPVAVSRHAYRIVQEALTNARKHAPGERATVRLAGGPDAGLTIEVVNRLAGVTAAASALGTGRGLAGLAERARLAGGRCDAGCEGGHFVVRAWLPW